MSNLPAELYESMALRAALPGAGFGLGVRGVPDSGLGSWTKVPETL